MMRKVRLIVIAAALSILATSCIDGGRGSTFTRNLSRTLVVSDAYNPEFRSRLKLDQTIADSNGTVRVTFINDSGICARPYWQLRLMIGAVDATVSGVSSVPVMPDEHAEIGSFSFRPSVELANIVHRVEFWYSPC